MEKFWMTSFSDDLALTIEILKSLTSNRFDYSDEAVWFPNDAVGYTHNNHPLRSMFGLPTDWTIYYKVDREDVIPHEICHVIDGISTHYQHSLKKDFKPIVQDYQTLWSLEVDSRNFKTEEGRELFRSYYSTQAEIFARLLNWHLFDNSVIPLRPIRETSGDDFARAYYMENKDVVDAYFNNRFGFLDKIDALNADTVENTTNKDLTEESIQSMSFDELYSHLDLSGTDFQTLGDRLWV